MLTPVDFSRRQAPSAVNAGRPVARAVARQARSPSDRPSGLVSRRNNPAPSAIGWVKGTRVSGIDTHHNVLRFLWRLVRADGTAGDTSIDFGETGPDGRLIKIVGFFGPPPQV